MSIDTSIQERINIFDEQMSEFVTKEFKDYLITNGFFSAPASTKFHGSYPGGLFDHSIVVMTTLLELTKKNDLHWSNPRSPYIIGMFHDLCKIDQYLFDDISKTYRWNSKQQIEGHGDKSVKLLSQFYELTEEEIDCITHHMGAFNDTAAQQAYTAAVKKNENVLWTHVADMIASQVHDT